ncbi:glycosyl hydrolases family 18 protein-like protein [Wilcoxina mikolae CBS 423.85]|nr:glycosyl hydrolases family 18 protein-like protein [Wilcoxina mikolae CBS 423.85]
MLIRENLPASPFDYSVKARVDENAPLCPSNTLSRRQVTNDDYSCSATKPCSNGACCSKKTGYCNYGPEACGTNGQSPNDVCWSNCDAHAECGKFAKVPGAKCPLNVCCSQYGFCGMTEEFCKKSEILGIEIGSGGCQSNCDQPGSGSSGGDVQSRVIGYYETWAHDRSCNGMNFKDIPVGGLTHLYFSFGYITPGDFNIAPMDNLPVSLFSDLTDMKRKNSGLKAVVALGGWTFNDNGTATQSVFSNMVSTKQNRAKFITNLLSFLREFAFDGVDFDWEYPGATDRGGHENDGINFTQFLKELRAAVDNEPIQYVISFTTPTSYWYLRHFDLKAVDHVDFVNVMTDIREHCLTSCSLHGTWDSNNPIGSHVLAHTNLTEIKQAMDLMWRNDVPANKLNLGIGFYGRSFQLSDPTCYKPGCNFKGGASPGGCTKNSGTLSFKEIMEIIDEHNLKPYYDKDNAVKYIVWNQDQWVSYDDEDTIKAKIKFANDLGLGGLLIWSIDQDTPDLRGLQAVLAPKSLKAFEKLADHASYWQDMTAQDCYVTDCGGSCNPGFLKMTTQPCGSATSALKGFHSTQKDSTLCCPLSAAPNPKDCRWRGKEPLCNGHCHTGEVMLQMNRWGNGKYCTDGNKAYCCDTPEGKELNQCYWTGLGKQCKAGDELFTFAGSILQGISEAVQFIGLAGAALSEVLSKYNEADRRLYCCPAGSAKKWKNCRWHGKPGSCFDNHCDAGHQVQLTQDLWGLGLSCGANGRSRVFCCDPADGKSPFLPVPLNHLFPHPPTGDNVDTNFEIKVDDTWGSDQEDPDTAVKNDPNKSTFGFWVLTSPETLQISLDKRDGSHWEVFNCNDAVSEEEQTVQMICTDISESSNCGKIYLGHGVPGTILEMPKGCGPSKYAVAKSMAPSKEQSLPHHLAKRNFGHKPVIYDLTFDYEWKRVPRDLGDTQLRVDFSNEEGYWDNIVEKAAKAKRKRSLADAGGNHKRWLEDEWRDDSHFGGLNKDDLHKRWFGSDVIEWLKGLISSNINPQFTHDIDQSFTAILLQEKWGPCNVGGVDIMATLDARATAKVQVATSFGLTLITTLRLPLDLSQSYLYFKNKGEVSAIFTLDAEGKAIFKTGDFEIAGLQNFPGATFSIPKLLTVGPNFKLFAAAEAEVTLSGHIESRVDIASWAVQQTYPDQGSDWDPKALSPPKRDITLNGLKQPTFDFSVKASGQITAHLKPTFIFGIEFDKMWHLGAAKVEIEADGWMRMYASAEFSTNSDNCPFTYGIDVGADLSARAEAPDAFGWNPRSFPIAQIPAKSLLKGDTCPTHQKRNIVTEIDGGNSLAKRDTFGPVLKLPSWCFFCPSPKISSGTSCATISGWDDSDFDPTLSKRDMSEITDYHMFDKRSDTKDIFICGKALKMISPRFPNSGEIITRPGVKTYGAIKPDDCNDFNFGIVGTPAAKDTGNYATEHILEFQLVKKFIDGLSDSKGDVLGSFWSTPAKLRFAIDGTSQPEMDAITWVGSRFPGRDNDWANELVLLEKGVNNVKERMWSARAINTDTKMDGFIKNEPDRAVRNIKDVIFAIKYHMDPTISGYLVKQATRVGDMIEKMDVTYVPKVHPTNSDGTYKDYKSLGLRAEWDAFIKGRAELARTAVETYMTRNIKLLRSQHVDITIDPNDPKATDKKILKTKVEKLDKAIKSVTGKWKNPF